MYNGGFRSNKRTPDGVGTVAAQAVLVAAADPQPTITSWSIQGSDDRALNPAGGQTVVVKGNGFTSGMTVSVGVTAIGSVTIVSSTQATFTSPAKTAGNYTLTMANANGQAAILVPGLAYSTIVTWTTPAGSIGTTYETAAFTESVVATSDSSITYTLASGSLPTGATLNANGVITGTAAVTGSPTTYSFSVTATDAELQDSTQSFTITVNPDTVTWVAPANNTSYSLTGNQPMSNVTLSATAASGSGITYSANALPTGVSLAGNVIYGTPTVAQTVSTLLTATANTTTRSSTETISWTVSIGDIYWPYVSLLLNGSTPTTTFINDASLNNNMLTIAGDTKPNLFTPYAGGYYSNYFNGSTDYLSWSGTTVGTQAFTIEFWVYATGLSGSSGNQAVLGTPNQNGLGVFLVNNTNISVDKMLVSGTNYAATLQNNTWYHIAVVRNASNVETVFINGVRSTTGTATDANNYSAATTQIGYTSSGFPQRYAGYISNLRMVVGSALYDPTQSTIAVPTSPLTAVTNTSLLTCQAPRFIDNSTNAYALTVSGTPQISSAVPFVASNTYATYGSAYFDGTGDYLTNTTLPAQGSGDFTIECWVYNRGTADGSTIFSVGDKSTTPYTNVAMFVNTTNLRLYIPTTTAVIWDITLATYLPTNAWTHHAVTRSGSTIRWFVNGVQVNSTASGSGALAIPGTYIGYSQAISPTAFTGQISDFRVINGTAVYTTNFTPPTSPLTAVANTQLLTCQYNGGATNNGFVDQSSFNNIITRNGNTTQGTFSPYSQTGWSNYFNGSGSCISVASNAAFGFGTGDYTVAGWFYLNSLTTSGGISTNAFLWDMRNSAGSTVAGTLLLDNSTFVPLYQVAGTTVITGSSAFVVNQWTYVVVSRVSGTTRMFINGIQSGSSYSDSNNYVTCPVFIARENDGNNNRYLNGYVSNFRIVKGSGVTSVTVPTTPLTSISGTSLLTCQSPRFIDNSPNNFALTLTGSPSTQAYSPFGGATSVPTSYSNYLNGSTDYITAATAASAFAFGTGDFTIEFWVYPNSLGGTQYLLATAVGGSADKFVLSMANGGFPRIFNAGTNGTYAITANTALTLNSWNHVAISRTSGTMVMYIRGILQSQTDTTNINYVSGSTVVIGATYTGTGIFAGGYISNLRVIKGTGLYPSGCTVPTSPLTAVAGTSLLTCQDSTFVDKSTNAFPITVTGTPTPYSYNPFGMTNTSTVSYTPAVNGGSMYFDGTGDYLTNSMVGMSTNNFTIEFWFYCSSAPGSTSRLCGGCPTLNSAWAANDWNFGPNNGSNKLQFACYNYNSAANMINSSATIIPYTWYHVALVRNSSSWVLYINGVADTTVTSAAALDAGTTFSMVTGWSGVSTDGQFTGYMSDVRITNGTALYTANFYPGPAPATPTVTIGASTYASNLLLNGTSGGIIDYHSTNNLETVGNTQLAPQDPYGGSYYSNYFDGTGDYITVPNNVNNQLSGSQYTIEMWLYPTATGTERRIFNKNGAGTFGYLVYLGTADVVAFRTDSTNMSTGLLTAPVGTWTHIAVTNDGTTTRIFVNGVLSTSATGVTITNANELGDLAIGARQYLGSNAFTGYMSNVRLIKGSALYTTNFTVPTSPLTAVANTSVLTCQSNQFKDNSSTAATITVNGNTAVQSINPFQQNTGKSLYFDGTGDYTSNPQGPQFAFGTGDYTIEAWVYRTDSGTQRAIVDLRGGAYVNVLFYMNSLNQLVAFNSTSTWITSTGTIPLNQWAYVAIARSGTSVKLFINGAVDGTATNSDNNVSSGPVYVGRQFGSTTNDWLGYIKDLRITKGVARYTTTFTPPTTPDQTK